MVAPARGLMAGEVVGKWAGGAGNAGQWRGLVVDVNDREEKQTEQRKGEF